ncbi:hypothetical protein LINPERPRIM_LOCUS18088 [Linum perenne]
MEDHLELERNLGNHQPSTTSNIIRAAPGGKKSVHLPERSKPEKHLSYSDLHHHITGSVKEIPSRLLGAQQKQHKKAATEEEELVKYMSNLPSYLEKGRAQQEKALNVGVLDWSRLEKWQYSSQQGRLSMSSNNDSCSSYASEGEPSLSSIRGQRFSPSRQRMRRPSLQFHLTSSPAIGNSVEGGGSTQDQNYLQTTNTVTEQATSRTGKGVSRDPREMNFEQWKRKVEDRRISGVNYEAQEVAKEKMKNRDRECTRRPEKMQERKVNVVDQESCQKGEPVVLLLPKDGPKNSHSGTPQCPKSTTNQGQTSAEVNQRSSLQKSEKRYTVVSSYESETDIGRQRCLKDAQNVCSLPHPSQLAPHRAEASNGRRIVEARESIRAQLNSGLKPGKVVTPEKIRSTSPFRRLSMGMGKIGRSLIQKETAAVPQSTSTSKFTNSIVEDGLALRQETSSCDKRNATSRGRSRSSPLRRMLDPLLKPKAPPNCHMKESSMRDSISIETCYKPTSRQACPSSGNSQAGRVSLDASKYRTISTQKKSTAFQALLRVAVKNGQPLFTFAVDNEPDILAATVKKLSASHNEYSSCIYTFFSIQEAKKKNGGWLNQGGKGKGKGTEYVHNVVAQLRVSGTQLAREFVLFGVDLIQAEEQETMDYQPNDELAAIVVKPMIENDERFISTTAVLPSGVHSIPTKGGPSSLLQRWRSGGSCDCGGWDLGCQLRVLANNPNQLQQNQGGQSEPSSTTDKFELIPREGESDRRPVFSLTPFKDGIHTVEFHSSLSTLQAFSLCIAVVDGKKLNSNSLDEKATLEAILARDGGARAGNGTSGEVPAKRYVAYPPVSPAGRV